MLTIVLFGPIRRRNGMRRSKKWSSDLYTRIRLGDSLVSLHSLSTTPRIRARLAERSICMPHESVSSQKHHSLAQLRPEIDRVLGLPRSPSSSATCIHQFSRKGGSVRTTLSTARGCYTLPALTPIPARGDLLEWVRPDIDQPIGSAWRYVSPIGQHECSTRRLVESGGPILVRT